MTAQRVIVTAGAAGIGAAIARAFLEAGARVGLCDVDEGAAAGFAEACPEAFVRVLDVADETAMAAFVAAFFDEAGGLDVLVNNAGTGGPAGPIESLAAADWRRCLAVNLDGAFHATKAAVPLLKRAEGGAIVNISSTAGLYGYPLRTPYAAAKWAIVGLTKSLAWELGPHGIRVNAVAPGAVAGPRMDWVIAAEAEAHGLSEEAVRASYLKQNALGCFIEAEDIAATCLYLASPAARRISGQVVAVDGNSDSLVH